MKRTLLLLMVLLTLGHLNYALEKPRNSSSSNFLQMKLLRDEVFSTTNDKTQYFFDSVNKCGLGVTFEIMQRWNSLTASQKKQYALLAMPPQTDTNKIIGRFIIYYDTAGISAPSLLDQNGNQIPSSVTAYVDSVGKIFNHVWEYEVDSLGYSAPPLESGFSYYRIFISELYSQGLYGRTQPTDVIFDGTPRRYATYIEIDNDFANYYSEGMNGLKVTAAHEFHHAIQLGNYGEWSNDYYFYEITSTWMEDVVYTEVNDYYQYLFNAPSAFRASQFSEPELSFVSNEKGIAYSRAVWGKFIEKRFSRNIILFAWEYMKSAASLQSLKSALTHAGSSLREALIEYSVWNAQAGPDCDTNRYYSEGKNYPQMNFKPVVQFVPPLRTLQDSIQSMASTYHPILVNGHTMVAMIMNVNTSAAFPTNYVNFSYDIAQSSKEGYKQLSNGLYVKLITSNPEQWYTVETVPTIVDNVIVYPNPMYSSQTTSLKFRLPTAVTTNATLDIFSASLRHVFSGELPIINLRPFEPGIVWNGQMNNGEYAPSGIYIFILKEGNQEYRGKFSILQSK